MPSISIEVDVRGLDSLLARLEFVPFVMDQEAGHAMEDSTGYVLDAVRSLTPVDTGRLYGSEKAQSAAYFSSLEGHVFTEVLYAPPVEEGHGEIRPKRAKALRFRPRGSGAYVYAQRVRPVAGVHMFRRGLDAAAPRVVDRFREAMKGVAKALAG